MQSYATGDRVRCVDVAPSQYLVREDARLGGFPANRVSDVVAVIDPTTA